MKRLFYNAEIFTSDETNLYADAMLIDGDTVAWVGKLKECSFAPRSEKASDAGAALSPKGSEKTLDAGAALSPKESEVLVYDEKVDMGGRRVIPGFVDSHMHAIMLANCCKNIAALPPVVYSIDELIGKIREEHEKRSVLCNDPADGDFRNDRRLWIEGWGYDESKFSEHRAPNRQDLDKGSSDLPVYVMRSCTHIAAVNSKALELAGITRETKDPMGGVIGRDENGEPNGILYENARFMVSSIMPALTEDDMVNNLMDLNAILLSQGVTTCSDMGEFFECDIDSIFERAEAKGFSNKVGYYYLWDYIKDKPDFRIPPEYLCRTGKKRVGGIKLISDGTVGGNTAWTESFGMPTCTEEDIRGAIDMAIRNKCQVSVHAMGNLAIERAVDIMAEKGPWLEGTPPCHEPRLEGMPSCRIEHVTMPSEHAMETAAKCGIAFVTQPIFEYCEIESYLDRLGPEKVKEIYPIRDWLDKGVRFAFSTDAPATSWAEPSDPLPCIKSAVTRIAWDGTDLGAAHRVSIEEAIKRYTVYGAKMLGFADTGMLRPGFKADFAVLDRDILQIDPMSIDKVKVDETYIDGVQVYRRSCGCIRG